MNVVVNSLALLLLPLNGELFYIKSPDKGIFYENMKTKQVLRQVEKYIAAKAQYAGLYGIVQERPRNVITRTLKERISGFLSHVSISNRRIWTGRRY